MKKFILFVILLGVFYYTYTNQDRIVYYIMVNYIDNDELVMGDANEYYRNYDYNLVQNTDNLFPSSKQDVLNLIYSALNRGLDSVTFYCHEDYEKCIDDINDIADDSNLLDSINNLVHPYNSYNNIYFNMSFYGKGKISFKRLYSEAEILLIEGKLKQIYSSLFYNGINDYDKIKLFHDYVINNTVYDTSLNSDSNVKTNANKATGSLFEGKAICSGYSDVMAIFLSNNGFNNYKINSHNHIWNLVFFDNKWMHIDLTWDDPVTTNGSNILIHDFFLIDTNSLLLKDKDLGKDNHTFNKNIYIEAN